MQDSKDYLIWDAVTPKAVTSSTDATPIVVTATAHGFATGDLVMIQGHTTNVAANGIFKVTRVTADTFSLQDYNSGADVAGSGAGAGSSGVAIIAPKILFCQDFKSIQFELETSSSASCTINPVGSFGRKFADEVNGNNTPNFGATQSKSNPWAYLGFVNLDDGSFTAGATGIVLAGTDVHKLYEINVNSGRFITFLLTAWTAGVITVRAKLLNSPQS